MQTHLLAWSLTDIPMGARYAIILFVISLLPLAIVWRLSSRKKDDD